MSSSHIVSKTTTTTATNNDSSVRYCRSNLEIKEPSEPPLLDMSGNNQLETSTELRTVGAGFRQYALVESSRNRCSTSLLSRAVGSGDPTYCESYDPVRLYFVSHALKASSFMYSVFGPNISGVSGEFSLGTITFKPVSSRSPFSEP